MTRQQKEGLVKRVAEIVAQMFRHKFQGIGSLYQTAVDASPQRKLCTHTKRIPRPDNSAPMSMSPVVAGIPQSPSIDGFDGNRPVTKYTVDRIVSISFFWHKRVNYDVYRGPFACSNNWLAARLAFVIAESEAILSDPDIHQRQKAFACKYSSTAKRLERQLANFFPVNSSCSSEVKPEATTLHHYDTSGYNVLVDDEGRLTALLDWDGVSVVPLWKACQMPEFLMSRYIDEMGDDSLGHIDGEYNASQISKDEAIDLEKAQLRSSFLAEMERLEPQWVEVHRTTVRSADFEVAVQLCDSLSRSDFVGEWLHDIEQGKEYWSLQQGLLAG